MIFEGVGRLGEVSQVRAPELLDAAIIFAADGALVPVALEGGRPGGRVVCGAIHMNETPAFAYERLWHERTLRSVANLTRADRRSSSRSLRRCRSART